MSNKVLIVCSGNSPDGIDFDIKRHHAFIYEQVIMPSKIWCRIRFFLSKGQGHSRIFFKRIQVMALSQKT